MLVVQLDGQAGSRATKHVRFDEPNMNEENASSQAASVKQNVKSFANAVRPKQRMKQERKYARRWTMVSRGSRRKRESLERGRLCGSTIFDNHAELNMR